MALEIIPAYHRLDDIRKLFREYTDMLVESDPDFAKYLRLQKYDDELLHPELKYGPPAGRLYLALMDGEVAGCIALHPMDKERCELKRLYVLPQFRGRGIARKLAERVVSDAKEIGYRVLLLDTLPSLKAALKLYESMGFLPVPPHHESPVPSIFMGLELR